MPAMSEIDGLREQMIDELRELGAILTPEVERAFRTVPRHVFVPEVPLHKAYAAEQHVVTRRDERGVTLSSVSAARIQAFMLEQAEIRPGMRVLEIGSGGYNAALITELVGEDGEVTSIDIDPAVVDRARRLLAVAGYGRVNVALVDGANGEPEHAPYDRIIVTVEAVDLATAWVDQLAEDGRIVVPLRVRGLNRSVGFQREGEHLVGRDYKVCGFVPMQGIGAKPERLVELHEGEGEEVGLRLDDERQVDVPRLRAALRGLRAEAWSGMAMGIGMPYDDLDLWLATSLPGYALLAATRPARERGLVAASSPMGVSTLIDDAGASFAYLAIRPANAERTLFEFGAMGHGPDAQKTADRLCAKVQDWDRHYRGKRAEFRAHPASTPNDRLSVGWILDGASRITITWPSITG